MLLPCSLDAGSAGFYAGARHPLWCKAERVLSRAAASRTLLCLLDADCAGLYADASHPVAQGGAGAA
jgi:hypothetical protein